MKTWAEVAAVAIAFSLLLVCQPAFPMAAEKVLTQERVEPIPGKSAIELQKSTLLKMEVIDRKNNYVEVAPPKKIVKLTTIEKIAQDLDNYLIDIKNGRINYEYMPPPKRVEDPYGMFKDYYINGGSKKEIKSIAEEKEAADGNSDDKEIPYYDWKDESIKKPTPIISVPEKFKVINREKAENGTSSIIQKDVIITKEPVKAISVPEKFKVINREKAENGTSCVIQKEVIITKLPEKKTDRPDIRRLNRSIPMFNQFNIENGPDDRLILK